MLPSLTFITSNSKKAEQLGYHLDYPIQHAELDLPEIQSLELAEIARAKAEAAFEKLQSPVLVEDTGLTFHALGKLPGPLIKWFLQELGNEGLCIMLDRYATREAKAEVYFGLFDGKKHLTFSASMLGTITPKPRGESGFGWDSIFIPQGSDKTWGEMDVEEQKQTSMRKIALQKLQEYLIQ